jgi:pyruvate,orthophosphate dikinase
MSARATPPVADSCAAASLSAADRRVICPIHADAPLAADCGADALGVKAFNLARMAALGLPVPPAFVIGTGWCADPAALTEADWRPALEALERVSGLRLGGARRPLLVSVRSGAPVSMPGMMDTLLNVGLCDGTVHGLIRLTGNPRLAWDAYRRLVQQFAEVAHGADAAPFRALVESAMREAGADNPRELDFRQLAQVTRESLALYHDLVGQPFPQDPQAQIEAAVAAVFGSWQSERAVEYRRLNGLPETLGTAVTVQRMVFGNAGGTSGAGVAFTRDPASGENRLYVDFLFNSQGEDVVSGRMRADDAARLADGAAGSVLATGRLARHPGGRVPRRPGVRIHGAGRRAVPAAGAQRQAHALGGAGHRRRPGERGADVPPQEGLARLDGLDLNRIERRRLAAVEDQAVLARGVPSGLGLAGGAIALDVAAVRRLAEEGRPALLVREEALTEDIAGLALCEGLLTARGSRTAHAVVVARQLGKPCLVGCAPLRIDEAARTLELGGHILREGDLLTLDGNEGAIYGGRAAVVDTVAQDLLARLDTLHGRIPAAV